MLQERSFTRVVLGSMARYFFDFHDDADLTVDDTGEDSPDVNAARDAGAGSRRSHPRQK